MRGHGGLVDYSRLLGLWQVKGVAGRDGKGKNQKGQGGSAVFVDVPLGTVVYSAGPSENRCLGEILEDGYKLFIAGGGEGGHGNTHFASSTMKVPLLAEEGVPGEMLEVVLELRLLADVALIGQPNAGKSQFLGAVSAARPAVAEYPFSTQQPELASVENGWSRYTMVELPGIVAGSNLGKGLGTAFLQHLWRARVLLHLVDGTAEDPVAALHEVNHEVGQYGPAFLERPQIVVVNKVDLPEVQERVPELRRRLARFGLARHFVSALTGEGVENLVGHVRELLERLPPVPGATPEIAPVVVPTPSASHPSVTREGGVFVLSSPKAERLVRLPDLRQFQVRLQLREELKRLGVVSALEDAGVQQGDRVRIGQVELRWE